MCFKFLLIVWNILLLTTVKADHWSYRTALRFCGILTNSSGTIESPPYPYDFPSLPTSCRWIIKGEPGSGIRLTFQRFSLAKINRCEYEYVEVFGNRSLLITGKFGRFCGETAPSVITTVDNVITVVFKADYQIANKGFTAVYSILNTTHGCNRIFSEPEGEIQSPRTPKGDRYPDNINCLYKIIAPAGAIIEVVFTHFFLEEGQNCTYDRLEILDYASLTQTNLKIISRHCGSDLPPVFKSTDNVVLLNFTTNEATGFSGFRAHYKAIKTVYGSPSTTTDPLPETTPSFVTTNLNSQTTLAPPISGFQTNSKGCGGVLTNSSGAIASPLHPQASPSGTSCRWIIKGEPGSGIILTFQTFSLARSNSCKYDYVEVFGNRSLLITGRFGRFCGQTTPPVLTSVDNVMTVVFKADSNIAAEGFTAVYSIQNTTYGCGGILTNSSGTIASPLHPQASPSGTSCRWILKGEPGSGIRLTFQTFSLARSNSCNYDYVEVFGNTSLLITGRFGRFCGQTTPPVLTSVDNVMTVVFKVDFSIAAEGFTAVYSILNTTNGCNRIFSEQEGEIQSPRMPREDRYPDNINCLYKIIAPAGAVIEVVFTQFFLDEDQNCMYDRLEILDYASLTQTNPKIISRHCGSDLPPVFKSTDNVVLLNFTTKEATGFSGFTAHYKAINTVYDCGQKHWGETKREQVPWQAEIIRIGCRCEGLPSTTKCPDTCRYYLCGGTILNKRWIVTAAQCLR
ncbi:tolloid-like protein 1 [Artemia franciscana]|uniref:tolloid-like protein 1 n=1 Tax=Artemia franciscana TaxID=6661 RepID=UPI0032DA8AD0